jgi:hypothetical protein
MGKKTRAQLIPCVGYVLDYAGNLVFAQINADDQISDVNAGKQPLDLEPSVSVWFTKHDVTRAAAKVTTEHGQVFDMNVLGLATLAPMFAKLGISPRTTRDHILHMTTAGVERARGGKFSDSELAVYEKQADVMFARIQAASQPSVATKAA